MRIRTLKAESIKTEIIEILENMKDNEKFCIVDCKFLSVHVKALEIAIKALKLIDKKLICKWINGEL